MSNDNTRIYKMEFFKDFVGTISQFQQLLRNLDMGQAGEQYGDAAQQRKLYEAISKGFTIIHPNPSVNSIDEGDLGTYIYVNGIYYKTLTGGANSVEANNFWTQWLTNNTIIDTQQIKFYKNGYATEEDSKQASSNIPGSVIFDQTHQAIFVDGLKYGGTNPLSNTVWVNLDLTENDTTSRIFKTYHDAINWIQTNGNPSATNLWQVNLPAGNVGTITLNSSIRVSATDGTYIEKLKSNKPFTVFTDVFDAYIAGAIIETIEIDNGECLALYNCVVKGVIPATTQAVYFASNTQFLGGDFENLVGYPYYSIFQDLEGDISNLTVADGYHTVISHVDGQPYNVTVGNVHLKFGTLSPSTITGDEIHLDFCYLTNNITLSSGIEMNLNNSRIVGTLTLSSGSTLYASNTNFDNILSKTTKCYVNNSHIDTLRVTEGGACSVNSGSINNCYAEDSSTLHLKNVHCNYSGIADTSILNTKGCNFDSKNIAETATWNNEGDAYNNAGTGMFSVESEAAIKELKALIDDIGIINLTYAQLKELRDVNELEVGQQYLITDFAQSYNILDIAPSPVIEEQIGVLEPIIVTAASTNSIYKEAISTLYPQDIIHYSLDLIDNRDIGFGDGAGTPLSNFKGMIYYREDTVQNVSTHYDFRNVKFRRWAVDAIEWTDIGFTAKDVIKSAIDGKIYKCILTHTATGIDPSSDAVNWILWLDITADAFVSWTSDKTQFNIGDITTDNLIINNVTAGVDYDDFYTFGDYYNWVKNVSIGMIDLEFVIDNFGIATLLLSQKVFKTTDNPYTCFSIKFGDNNLPMTFGNGNSSMTFGNNNLLMTFGNNNLLMTFGNGNSSMTFGNGNSSITFGYNNRSMTFGNYNRSLTFGDGNVLMTFGNDNGSLTFGDHNSSMTFRNENGSLTFRNENGSLAFGDNNYSMTFGNSNYSLAFGGGNYEMTFGNYNSSMTFGDNNESMTFGNNNSMTFGDNNYLMTFGDNNLSMTFGDDNNSMAFGDYTNPENKMITFGDNTTMCVFEHRCFTGLVADLDLSAATHIKGTYNTTIYQDAVDGVKLSYMSGGMMQIVDITD